MLDRESTFADSEIVAMLKTRFVPVAIDQWYTRRQQDTEGEFYRKIAGQGPRNNFNSTTQGLYIADPSGKLIAFNNNRGPERIRGFVEIAAHPWFIAVCEAVLGTDYRIVEVGFDIPFPGAADQPWHRDFAVPDATRVERRLNSLAFNLTAVDTRPDMGPFEIAPGTQWDEFEGCERGMFPPQPLWPRYAAKARSALPQRGDMSARSALTIHRGTANRSDTARPVLVVGVDAPDAVNSAHHDLQVTPAYLAQLPPSGNLFETGRFWSSLTDKGVSNGLNFEKKFIIAIMKTWCWCKLIRFGMINYHARRMKSSSC